MTFLKDEDAIMWALRKGASTRTNTTGGLGLYILRKNVYEMQGKFLVLSGNARLQFDDRFYNPRNENIVIQPSGSDKRLGKHFSGNVIMITVPFEEKIGGNNVQEGNVLTCCLKDLGV